MSSIKNANLFIKYEGIKLQKCVIACKKDINVVVRFQYSEMDWLENSTFHIQLSWTRWRNLKDELSATSSASSSSKTLWWRWGCRRRPPGHLFGGNFEKLNKKKLVRLFLIFLIFLIFLEFLTFFSAVSSASSSSKTLWGSWHLFGGNFEKLNKKKLVRFFFFFTFFWFFWFFHLTLWENQPDLYHLSDGAILIRFSHSPHYGCSIALVFFGELRVSQKCFCIF